MMTSFVAKLQTLLKRGTITGVCFLVSFTAFFRAAYL